MFFLPTLKVRHHVKLILWMSYLQLLNHTFSLRSTRYERCFSNLHYWGINALRNSSDPPRHVEEGKRRELGRKETTILHKVLVSTSWSTLRTTKLSRFILFCFLTPLLRYSQRLSRLCYRNSHHQVYINRHDIPRFELPISLTNDKNMPSQASVQLSLFQPAFLQSRAVEILSK